MHGSINDVAKESTDRELAAELVAESRQLLIDLDRLQNQQREALRALKQRTANPPAPLWLLCSGGVFVQCDQPYKETLDFFEWRLQRGRRMIEEERDELKQRVVNLAQLEGPDSALARLNEGFQLKPVSSGVPKGT